MCKGKCVCCAAARRLFCFWFISMWPSRLGSDASMYRCILYGVSIWRVAQGGQAVECAPRGRIFFEPALRKEHNQA